jgi:hypothetical protein
MYNRIDALSGIYKYNYNTQIPTSSQNVAINYIMAGPISSVSFPDLLYTFSSEANWELPFSLHRWIIPGTPNLLGH